MRSISSNPQANGRDRGKLLPLYCLDAQVAYSGQPEMGTAEFNISVKEFDRRKGYIASRKASRIQGLGLTQIDHLGAMSYKFVINSKTISSSSLVIYLFRAFTSFSHSAGFMPSPFGPAFFLCFELIFSFIREPGRFVRMKLKN